MLGLKALRRGSPGGWRHHVFDDVGAGQRAAQIVWQAKAAYRQDFVDPFEKAARHARRLALQPQRQVAQELFGLVRIIHLPGLPERFAHRRLQALGSRSRMLRALCP